MLGVGMHGIDDAVSISARGIAKKLYDNQPTRRHFLGTSRGRYHSPAFIVWDYNLCTTIHKTMRPAWMRQKHGGEQQSMNKRTRGRIRMGNHKNATINWREERYDNQDDVSPTTCATLVKQPWPMNDAPPSSSSSVATDDMGTDNVAPDNAAIIAIEEKNASNNQPSST